MAKNKVIVMLTAAFALLVVGAGCVTVPSSKYDTDTEGQYHPPQKRDAQDASLNKKKDSATISLYEDKDYGIAFTVAKECKDFYSVKPVANKMNEVRNYGVFASGSTSKGWPKDFPWYYYSLYTQSTYDRFNPNELPGKPEIKLRLPSGELLTWWSPQDGPAYIPRGCQLVKAELIPQTDLQKTVSPEAELKTYKNAQYGFELQYPSAWKVEDGGVGVGISINPPDFQAPASGTVVPYFSFDVVAHGAAVDEQPVTRVFGARTGYVYAKGNMIFIPRDVDGWYYMTYRPGVKEVGQIINTLKFTEGSTAIDTMKAPVAIASLQPSTGKIGAAVKIIGTGFTATGNKIKFGNLGMENNPASQFNSYDGKTLVFTVPRSNYMSCWSAKPACMAPAFLTQPGTYQVSVINANGTSNEMPFVVTGE